MSGATESRSPVSGRHDSARRRRGLRKQRETGISIYIPGEALEVCGFDPYGPAPAYRIWPAPRGRLAVQLYREA